MSFLNCNVNFLLKDELEHELSTHKITYAPGSDVDKLRKLLRFTLKLARRGSFKSPPTLETADPEREEVLLQVKGETIIKAFEDANVSESSRARTEGRANYILTRISRVSNPSEELLALQGSLVGCLADDEGSSSSASENENDGDTSHYHSKTVIYKPEKSYNLNSLNLKFKGDTCVRAFLSRLQELYVARKIPKECVFTGFPDLIEGPALYWYRANKHKFSQLDELLSALQSDFDLPDFDYRLLQEIRSRTQAKDETLVVFLSTVIGMMSRLNTKLSESEKLEIVLRNIRPEYSRELALIDVRSIDHLQELGKKLELCKARVEKFTEPSFSKDSVAQDFNYKLKSSTQTVRASSIQSDQPPKPNNTIPRFCLRCGDCKHPTSRCPNSREIMCFKCGLPRVKTPDCPRCNPSKN